MNAGRVSRRTIVLGAAAVGLAGCARPPIVITSPTATPGGSVREKLAATMSVYQKNTPKLGIAIKDLPSQRIDHLHAHDAARQYVVGVEHDLVERAVFDAGRLRDADRQRQQERQESRRDAAMAVPHRRSLRPTR